MWPEGASALVLLRLRATTCANDEEPGLSARGEKKSNKIASRINEH
jgi:hypothetical protein